jgi:uncharacterized membrane protein YjjP (DUF1212 family)
MDSQTEPVRLTNWITAVITALIGAAIVYLQTNDWRASALAALAAVSGLVGAGEVARQQVVSPRTLELSTGKTLDQLK